MDLETDRARRWWRRRRPIASIQRAAAFVDDVGFALLFPTPGLALPSLWEAASDRPLSGWGPDIERVWGWKDELPLRGLAWYGRFVRGRQSFLSLDLLEDLYPREGAPEDFLSVEWSPDARRVAEILLVSGPTSTAALREAMGVAGSKGGQRFSRAIGELGRGLAITHFGTEEQGGGWPSAVLELTARVFPHLDQGRLSPEERQLRAARRFLATTLEAGPSELGRAFGWRTASARELLEGLIERGRAFGWRTASARELLEGLIERGNATRIGATYRLATPSGPSGALRAGSRATGRVRSRPHSSHDAS